MTDDKLDAFGFGEIINGITKKLKGKGINKEVQEIGKGFSKELVSPSNKLKRHSIM